MSQPKIKIEQEDLDVIKELQNIVSSLKEQVFSNFINEYLVKQEKDSLVLEVENAMHSQDQMVELITKKYGEGKVDLKEGTIELFQ